MYKRHGSPKGRDNLSSRLETLPFLRHYLTFGLHYIDYALPQAYNVFVIMPPCER